MAKETQIVQVSGHAKSRAWELTIGISLYPNDGRDADSLLKNADAAMYQAKAAGGNGYRFYTA